MFLGPWELKNKWIPRFTRKDHRRNATIIIECSNVCPFRWKSGSFICAYCSTKFADFPDLKTHTVEHTYRVEAMRFAPCKDYIKVEITDLKCGLCLVSIPDVETLRQHLVTVHNKPLREELPTGVLPFVLHSDEFFCADCGERFEVFSKLNKHINAHYPNSVCSVCGKAFSSMAKLKAHLESHQISKQVSYKCSKCDETFSSYLTRNKHVKNAHGSKYKYNCLYCNERFKRYLGRVKHLKEVHGKQIEYACHLCSAVFPIFHWRTKHIRTVHAQHREFACDVCSYRATSAPLLKNHMLCHTGEKKFQCQVCKKAYTREKTLKEHMRIHNNDKRFKCTQCDYASVQKCSLVSHMRTRHPVAQTAKSNDSQ